MGTWSDCDVAVARGCGWIGGGGKRDRTADLLHAMQALSQLSYTPTANRKLYGAGSPLANVRRAGPAERAPRRLSSRACPIVPDPNLPAPARHAPAAPAPPVTSICPDASILVTGATADSAGRSRWRAPRAARRSCCTDASCASSRRSTTRSSPPGTRSRRSCRSISRRRRADDFDNVAGAIRAQLGRLDGLVHTAAFLGSLGPIEHQSFDAWQKVLRVNVGAAMALTRVDAAAARGRARRLRRVHARHARRRSARVLGRLRGGEGGARRARDDAGRRMGESRESARQRRRPRADALAAAHARRIPAKTGLRLPPPEALVPLYLYLLGAQPKAESGVAHRRAGVARRSAGVDAARVSPGTGRP